MILFYHIRPSNTLFAEILSQAPCSFKKKSKYIYDTSPQNYNTPKITTELPKSEKCCKKTVGNYIRQTG